LCLQQPFFEEELLGGTWESIEKTVLEVCSGGYQGDVQETHDPEQAILEVVGSQWTQRVATKLQKCTVEEHPEATAVSTIARTLKKKKFLVMLTIAYLCFCGVAGSEQFFCSWE
jgi:hypothetical protein